MMSYQPSFNYHSKLSRNVERKTTKIGHKTVNINKNNGFIHNANSNRKKMMKT